MKKTIIAAALVLLAVLILTGISCARRQTGGLTIREGVLLVGLEPTYPPFESLNERGELVGFDVEMAKALAERMGVRAEFIQTDFDGLFAAVETRRFDVIISAVTINPERLAVHNFSRPYVTNELAMVIRINSAFSARSPMEAEGLEVAFQGATTSDNFMMDLADEGLNFNARRYNSMQQCFMELELGRVDMVMTDLAVAEKFVEESNGKLVIVWTEDEGEFGIVLKKGNDALTDTINNTLAQLFADGTIARIAREHLGTDAAVSSAHASWN
jgi:ABC-type amino acid transport substrate-binding protein